MLNKNKKAVIFIYVLFLLSIAIILAMVIMNNSSIFFDTVKTQDIIEKTNKNIQKKANSVFKLAKFYNSNWSWFTDNISCPISIFMSWSTNSWYISSTNLDYNNWNINCYWVYNSTYLNIFFNSNYTNFSWATYSWSYTDLDSWSWLTNFLDSDLTNINFSTYWLNWIDNIDDNFNSDNYSVSSTWNIFYSSGYFDDDANHRKKIFWYIEPYDIDNNIFFNNYETNLVISGSLNNNDSINIKISETSTWYAILNVDNTYDLKIVKFDKTKYDTNKELLPLETNITKNISPWYWYIQKSSTWVLSIYEQKTWNEYIFNFVNYYYWIFITNNSSLTLNYNLSFENNSGSWIYIVPIDDNTNYLKFLWNNVVYNYWKYLLTQYYIIWKK